MHRRRAPTAQLPAAAGQREREEGRTLGLGSGDLADTLRYQLLHRTASAILTAQHYGIHRAAMVVQSFSPDRAWFDDFARFAALFGIAALARDRLHDAGTPSGIALRLGWATAPFRSP